MYWDIKETHLLHTVEITIEEELCTRTTFALNLYHTYSYTTHTPHLHWRNLPRNLHDTSVHIHLHYSHHTYTTHTSHVDHTYITLRPNSQHTYITLILSPHFFNTYTYTTLISCHTYTTLAPRLYHATRTPHLYHATLAPHLYHATLAPHLHNTSTTTSARW